ncbi:MAG: Sec-independent protein translocase protein TatB, partial [Pseudomonadales bacterium]
MFDIGFPELLIVSIVALLVIGPEKLPETVRTIALWLGRLRRSLANIKMELENELGADEIRRQLHNDSIMKELDDARQDLNGIINDTNSTITEIKDSAKVDTNLKPKPDAGRALDHVDKETENENGGATQSEQRP